MKSTDLEVVTTRDLQRLLLFTRRPPFLLLSFSPLPLCLMSPWRMRMKWRLFSVSLSVSMAMPPMPEFSCSDVSVELNVSADRKHYHIEYWRILPTHTHPRPLNRLRSSQPR